MVFTSVVFIFYFLPLTVLLYFLVSLTGSQRAKNWVLLIASLIFYSWGGLQYTFLILFSTIVNFVMGLFLDRNPHHRKGWLAAAMVVNLALLGFFKYFNFFTDTTVAILQIFDPTVANGLPRIPLPIGISFFTFQIMTYVIDLYRGEVPVQKNYFDLALYIMLFPQLIAGPIVRYADVDQEIRQRRTRTEDLYTGIRRFMLGFAKKMLLANQMGEISDAAFGLAVYDNMLYSWMGVAAYAFHIFLDFSAYSDMAIGLGKMFGFHFKENFNYPYISRTVREFWRRWHISLSTFFRDYLYIPLGGSRKGTAKTYRNLLIVFFLTGLWHGASWNFVVWGLWFGVFLVLERAGFGKVLDRLPTVVRWLYCMLVVLVGWVFFRAETLPQAAAYLQSMFVPGPQNWQHLEIIKLLNRENLCWLLCSILICIPKGKLWNRIDRSFVLRDVLILAAFFLSLCYLLITDFNPFIYFRF